MIIILLISFLVTNYDQKSTKYTPFVSALTPHSAIIITDDSGFNVFPGTGTEIDPYVIDGYNITTTDNNGIYITLTTKYFVISNCYIDALDYGIYIDNIADSTTKITNNTCENSDWYGIYISLSLNSTLINNTCTNTDDGIHLFNSAGSNLINNTCTNNQDGIVTDDSINLSLIKNNCTDNSKYGIWMSSAFGSTIIDNICKDNNWLGIHLVNSPSSVLTNNNCSNNDEGIYLYESTDSVLNNNTCNYNSDVGIRLYYSHGSIVANNSFYNSGLYIWEYSIVDYLNYTIENNKINNKELGYLTNLNEEVFSEPVYGQLIIINCTDIIVSNQELSNATIGLYLISSENNVVTNNTCNNNWLGILTGESSGSTLTNNTCNNNGRGGIDISDDLPPFGSLTVTNNSCSDNGDFGIYLESPEGSIIANNIFYNNGLVIDEYLVEDYLNCTVTNNKVNNKILGYFTNLNDAVFSEPVYGQLFIINCTEITVSNQELSNATQGLKLVSCEDCTLVNNTCNNNEWGGIHIRNSDYSTVTNNTCNNNGDIGIYFSSSDFCDFTYNLLQENVGYGVYLRFDCDNNFIHHNTFVDNRLGGTSQAYDDGQNNYWYDTETLEGNYWSDWSGSGSYSIAGEAFEYDLYPLNEQAVQDLTGPIITGIIHLPSSPTDENIISIRANVTDSSDVKSVTLHYCINSGSWQTDNMVPVSGIIYELFLGPYIAGTNVEYYITAIDDSLNHNEATDNNNSLYYHFSIASSDYTEPTITVISHDPSSPNDLETITISATVSDSSGIDSVTLHYRINGGSWSTTSMTLSTGSIYQATIGPFTNNSIIEYYITAMDNSTNYNEAIDDNNALYYSFTVYSSVVIPEFSTLSLFLSSFSILFLFIILIVQKRRRE